MKWMTYLAAALIMSWSLACSKDDKAAPQLTSNDEQAAAQREEARQEQQRAQAEQDERAKMQVAASQARHGHVTLRGLLVKDSESLKEEFAQVISVDAQNGRNYNGEIVGEDRRQPRLRFETSLGAAMSQRLSSPVQQGSALVAGLEACLADVEIDQECLDSTQEEDWEQVHTYPKKVISFACQLNREFGLQVSPFHIRSMTEIPVRGSYQGGQSIAGLGYSGHGVNHVILCGSFEMADLAMISVVAPHVVLKNFQYQMHGNYGSGLFEMGAGRLYLMGGNRIESQGREGGQVHPPAVHLEVASRLLAPAGASLSVISQGSDVDEPSTSSARSR